MELAEVVGARLGIKIFAKTLHVQKKSYLCSRKKGTLPEWLGIGLQNRGRRFESARYLKKRKPAVRQRAFALFCGRDIHQTVTAIEVEAEGVAAIANIQGCSFLSRFTTAQAVGIANAMVAGHQM